MAAKSFTESGCNAAQSFGPERYLSSERGIQAASDFTVRSLSQPMRPGTRMYPPVTSQPRSMALQWSNGCSDDVCYGPSVDALTRKDLEYQGGFSRDNGRDLSAQRSWDLLMNPPTRSIRTRDDMARMLQQEAQSRHSCVQDPSTLLNKTLPLFNDGNENSQQIIGDGDRSYAYRLGAAKEMQPILSHTISLNQGMSQAPFSAIGGQFSRQADPTNKFCRSDFAAGNLGPL